MVESNKSEIYELYNQYFQDKIFRDAYFKRLYKPEDLEGFAHRNKTQKKNRMKFLIKKKQNLIRIKQKKGFMNTLIDISMFLQVLEQVTHIDNLIINIQSLIILFKLFIETIHLFQNLINSQIF
ncbi:unnamed protein product [Paramecium sonneborni]|uniref:Uncharacterized protein n=1 Tax=Paramecium sonneborni TaxID=65129 RepID=A0A8S1L821_9CILI|nr:unnamed protein product [Paramecium sonneborni]